MKTIWKIAITFLLIGNLVALGISGKTATHTYPLAAQVYGMNQADDSVTFVDGAGNQWKIYGMEDWQLGDVAALMMNDNGTPEYIYDDSIVGIRYGFSLYPKL